MKDSRLGDAVSLSGHSPHGTLEVLRQERICPLGPILTSSLVFPLPLALPSTFVCYGLSSLLALLWFLAWHLSDSPSLCFQALIKQDNLDAFNERDPYKADDSREEEEENDDDNSLEGETFPLERDEVMPPPLQHPQTDRLTCPKGLPWAPKVR